MARERMEWSEHWALHVVDPGLIPGTTKQPSTEPGVSPWHNWVWTKKLLKPNKNKKQKVLLSLKFQCTAVEMEQAFNGVQK